MWRPFRKLDAATAPASPTAPVDLATIRSLASAVVKVRHPITGELLGATVTLASPDHPARRQAKLDIARANRERPEPTDDEAAALVDETALDFLCRIILDWTGIKVDGVDLVFSAAAARELLARTEMRWLLNQLLTESGHSENFIETSAPA